MSKQWVSKRKLVSLNQVEVAALEAYSQASGRTETEIIREALREYLTGKGTFKDATPLL
jgi:predicted DNA-binding protein